MNDYCPGAVRVDQPGGGGLDTSLPPRAVWHITWDALRPDGSQPQYSAVANYLKNQGYCPHLMWNPFTGYIEQYYPASQSARALAAWNGDGAACIQIEVFFSPGCVVDGVKYDTVADTPLKGLPTILAWLDSLGIPRTWPLGSPQWSGNSRDANIWNTQGGHYGHCHVPDNTHTDPGPMPPITGLAYQSESTPQEDDMPWNDKFDADVRGSLQNITDKIEDLPNLDRDLRAAFDTVTDFQRDVRATFDVVRAQNAALIAANGQLVEMLASSKTLSVEDIRAALAGAIADGVKVSVSVNGAAGTAPVAPAQEG